MAHQSGLAHQMPSRDVPIRRSAEQAVRDVPGARVRLGGPGRGATSGAVAGLSVISTTAGSQTFHLVGHTVKGPIGARA